MRAWLLAIACASFAAGTALAQSVDDDPYIWLEDVSSPRAMAWVAAHNARTEQALTADPRYASLYAESLVLAGDKDRIPVPEFANGEIINFWEDQDHLRGIMRATSLADYAQPAPDWTTILDIDALGKAEGRSWVFRGQDCLPPVQRRCLISLSDGGEDAVEVREFDLGTHQFVADGFHLPRGKHRVSWEDADHLLVDGQGHRLVIVQRPLDTFRRELWVPTSAGVKRLDVPQKADIVGLVGGHVILRLDEQWQVSGMAFPAGAVVSLALDQVKAGDVGKPVAVWTPGPREALEDVTTTRDQLLVNILDNVRGKVWSYTPTAAGWTRVAVPLPDDLSLRLGSADLLSDRAFISANGFLTPPTLYLVETAKAAAAPIKSRPPKFDASRDVVEQFEAASSDGTRIPYFVVHRRDIHLDGSTPTLMTAYGGFQVNNTPAYSAALGKLWLEKGGAYVLANIRGGGEFGPAWHEAGLGIKRQIIYDDFSSVARDLIARRITSPRRLGIQGGSNGGLLMGVEFIQHPDLWHAVVIDVPLLDMIRIARIAAGASWQGEYGDVNADPAVMQFWRRISPYQNLKPGVAYPQPFIFTTTKDDRVGPQHARKFAARMEQYGLPFYFYENTEGGHGPGADIRQDAKTEALTMTYLTQKLMD